MGIEQLSIKQLEILFIEYYISGQKDKANQISKEINSRSV